MAIDNALKNPVVTSVLAVKSGDDFVAVGETSNPLPVTTYPNTKTSAIESSVIGKLYKAWATAPATTALYFAQYHLVGGCVMKAKQ